MDRNLDGVYFRIVRNGKSDNVCFSDLSKPEMEEVLEGKSAEWLKYLCYRLGEVIKEIGDEFDIEGGH